MKLRKSAPRVGMHAVILLAALWVAPFAAHADHVGDALTSDRQLAVDSDRFLAAFAQWRKLPPSLKASNLAPLVQLAQAREQSMLALIETQPKVAAARMLPRSIRARLPAEVAAHVEDEVRVQGTGFVNVADNFAAGVSRSTFKVQGNPGNAPQSVFLAGGAATERDLHKLAGKKLTFTAMRVAGTHLVILDKKNITAQDEPQAAGGSTTTTAAGASAAGGVVQGEQKTLSILLNFSDKALTCSAADVAGRVSGSSGTSVNTLYKESSRGLVTFSGTAVGPFNTNYASTGSCDYNGWANAGEAAAKAAGIDTSQYTRVNYVTPANSSCGWTGLAYMPGRQSWVASCSSTGLYAHELGHNLALHHAATPTSEYGDNSDPMGSSRTVDSNGPNRVMAGWQPSGTVVDVGSGGSYSVTSVSDTSAVTPQVLRIAKPDTYETYYVSLRTAIGHDAGLASQYLNTVSVHRAYTTLPTRTYLMQSLAAGQSFNDSTNGITITNQGVAGHQATIGVTLGGGSCARVAPSVALTPASQTAAPGSTVGYTMAVTNNNSAACGSSTFNLAQVLPTGFSGSLSATTLALGSGASGSVTWSATSAQSVAGGSYALDATVADASATASVATGHASYVVFQDSAPPVVSFVSPKAGATVSGKKPYTIEVSAGDASGIQVVEIYVDGQLLASDTATPYTASWNLRKAGAGAHTITAKAIDNSGLSTSTSVTVNVN